MPHERADLLIRELEYRCRHPLLCRTLAEYAELTQPQTDTGRFPTIAVTGEDELMPVSAPGMPVHRHPEFGLGGSPHYLTAGFRRSRVPHRLMLRIAAIPNQMCQQRYPVIGPFVRLDRFQELPRYCEPVARAQVVDSLPAERCIEPVFASRPDRAATRQLQLEYRLLPYLPDEIRHRARQAAVLSHGE